MSKISHQEPFAGAAENSVWSYIKSDYYRHASVLTLRRFMRMVRKNRSFRICVWLRLATMAKSRIIRLTSRRLHKGLSLKTGMEIPLGTKIGRGFYIGHGQSVIIHPKTIIGENCNISQFTTIGSNKNTPAIIGNNVYIGPGVCIVENVKIGDNSVIGAGSVVVQDVPANCTVAGNPARVISNKPNSPERWSN